MMEKQAARTDCNIVVTRSSTFCFRASMGLTSSRLWWWTHNGLRSIVARIDNPVRTRLDPDSADSTLEGGAHTPVDIENSMS